MMSSSNAALDGLMACSEYDDAFASVHTHTRYTHWIRLYFYILNQKTPPVVDQKCPPLETTNPAPICKYSLFDDE